MQQLKKESTILPPELESAALLMELVPRLMQRIRTEMRCHSTPMLSVSELRTLIYLYRNEGASLSEVAEFVDLKLPSMSKTIDALVARRLVIRKTLANDRRYVSLKLSKNGTAELMRTRSATEARLAKTMSALPSEQQAKVIESLKLIGEVFAAEATPSLKESK